MPFHGSYGAALRLILLPLAMGHSACSAAALRSPSESPRVRVEGGRFSAGLDADAKARVMALCRSTSEDSQSCAPGITHNEGHVVTLSSMGGFEIDRLEVSQARYQDCVQAGQCTLLVTEHCVYGDDSRPADAEWAVLRKADHPVVCVSFTQAEMYCRWSGGRVPSEVEWERAARGEDGRIFPWGNEWRPTALNWGDDGLFDGHILSAPVGSYPSGASPRGALDMVGNVWEWAYRFEAFDAEQLAGKQVIRGGGFAAAPHAQRTTKRIPYTAARAYPNVGFRCAYGAGP